MIHGLSDLSITKKIIEKENFKKKNPHIIEFFALQI